jgi:hypothetical protein
VDKSARQATSGADLRLIVEDVKRSVSFGVLVGLWLPIALVGCGKKGPPLAPLNLVPEAVGNVTARRLGSTVYLQMSVPSKNANGPGPVAVDRLEIYAVTAAAGAATPPNRELLTSARIIGRIPVKPPVSEDEPPPPENGPKDTRPAPGETVTFTETLTEAQMKPQIPPAPKPAHAETAPSTTAAGAAATPPATEAPGETPATPTPPPAVAAVPAAGGTSIGGAATPPPSTPAASPTSPASISVPTRIYVVRGITRRGRPGSPSARLTVPLIPPPPYPNGLATSFSETAVTVTWLPPVLESGSSVAPLTYNVYAPPAAESSQGDPPKALNEKPLEALSFEHAGARPGVEQCFVVRTVQTVEGTMLESEPSMRACVIPRDIFPPAAPKALSAVAGPGAVNLIWDANTESDLAGYVVLRAEAPGDTLQPLNSEPTRETRYRDTTVTAGVRYVYAIVAIDRAGNRSAASTPVEETAR